MCSNDIAKFNLISNRKGADLKRDMDLVREILLEIEREPQLDGTRPAKLSIQGRDPNEVGYVVDLLIQAGFVTGPDRRPAGAAPIVKGLTWQGHELLDNIRDPGVWEKTKEKTKPLLSVSIAILAELAKAEIKRQLGLP